MRKELQGDDAWEKVGKNEHTINAYLQHLDHPNILPLLATYTQEGVTNFLLPLAEEGDLDTLLKSSPKPESFVGYSVCYEALHGLASALESLHGFKLEDLDIKLIGHHHDIKPKNVLVRDKRFILADFGLSKLKDGSNSKSPFKVGQGHYLAPECEDGDAKFKKGIVGRSSDIWSLGCIMLEVIVFMVGDADSLSQFRERRKFKRGLWTTSTFFCGDSINIGVTNEMNNLIERTDSIPLKKSVNLIGQILNIDPEKRPKASEVAAGLRLISLEHSFLKSRDAITNLNEEQALEVQEEFPKFIDFTKRLGFGNDAVTIDFNDLVSFKDFVKGSASDDLLESMGKLVKKAARVAPQALQSTSLASDLRNLNEMLTTLLARGADIRPSDEPGIPIIKYFDYVWKRHCSYVCVSPDGSLFASMKGRTIEVCDIRTGAEVQTISHGPFPSPEGLRFSPDSRYLFIVRNHTRKPHLVAYPLKGNERSIKYLHWFNPGSVGQRRLVAVTSDSSKVAVVYKTRQFFGEHRLVVLKGPTYDDDSPTRLPSVRCSGTDSIFSFSPDGHRLAFSNGETKWQDGQHIIEIRLLDLRHTAKDDDVELMTLECNEKFCDRSQYSVFQTLNFYGGMFHWKFYSHLVFRQLDGVWAVGIWSRSDQVVTFWDMSSKTKVSALSLSCFNEDGKEMDNTTFSGNVAGTRIVPTPERNRRPFGSGGKEQAASLIAFADMGTNQPLCKLEGESIHDYFFSQSKAYVITSQSLKKHDHDLEHRIFDIGKFARLFKRRRITTQDGK